MPSEAEQPIAGSDPTWKQVAVFVVVLLALRLSGMYTWYFWEEDELSLVTGIAALVNNEIGGGLYRYSPQLGYYRLVEAIAVAFHLPITLLPYLVKTLSALSGVAIPVLGLFFARDRLSTSQRWALAGLLAINPVIWHSARYGNSGMVQTAIALTAIVLLSNGARGRMAFLALSLMGLATLVRADAVLLWPVAAWLLWRNYRDQPSVVLRWGVGFTVGMVTLYGLLFLLDPRVDSMSAEVAAHVFNIHLTMFWEYLLWSISPIPLIFAALGARRLLIEDRPLAAVIAVWCLFPFLFYFSSTTTPRYFLMTAVPLTVLTVVGAFDLTRALSQVWRPVLVRAAVAGALCLHLFIGLGHFAGDRVINPLLGPSFRTHDGPFPTGALLYFTYNSGSELLRHLVPPSQFGVGNGDHEGFRTLIDDLQREARPGRTAVVLLNSGYGHGFHYYALAEGAEYESRVPGMYFATETWLRLDGLRIMTIASWSEYYAALDQLPVQSGDLVYVVWEHDFSSPEDRERLPPGVTVTQAEQLHSFFKRYDVF